MQRFLLDLLECPACHGALAFRRSTQDHFTAAGLRVTLESEGSGPAEPAPRAVLAVLIEGAAIDGFPIAPTALEWCVLVAQ